MNSIEIHERDDRHISVDCIFDLNTNDINTFPLLQKLAKKIGTTITTDDIQTYILLSEKDDSGNIGNHIKVLVKFSDEVTAGNFAHEAWLLLTCLKKNLPITAGT